MKPRNNNAKRAETLGRVAVQKTAKKNSMNSPWRKQAFCQTERARKFRQALNDADNATTFDNHVDVSKVPF